jgi:hypothetical protein
LADPEGNLFCAFPPRSDRSSPAGPFELVVDCADPLAQANWWAGLLGGVVRSDEGGDMLIEDAAGFPWESWCFDLVPEGGA